MAYDRYAAALYGYCHWMLHDSADAAEALKDTFVIAAATLGDLSEPAKLRPWLFALARNECRRRIRPGSATRDEEPMRRASRRRDRAATGPLTRGASGPTRGPDWPTRPTVRADAVGPPSDAAGGASDATMQFRAVGPPSGAIREPSDVTMQFPMIGLPPTRLCHSAWSASRTNGLAHVNGDQGQAELRTLIYSILAELKPREREVIELSFRHDLHGDDLAIALGVSSSRRTPWPHAPAAGWRKPSVRCTSRLPDGRPARCWGNCWPTGTGS